MDLARGAIETTHSIAILYYIKCVVSIALPIAILYLKIFIIILLKVVICT